MKQLLAVGLVGLATLVGTSTAGAWADVRLPENDELMKALVDEMDRSIQELALDDLPRPYFIQYLAQDRVSFNITASYGGVTASNESRRRTLSTRVRVGSYELDNTNTGRGFGYGGALPLDADYWAFRHAIWKATDRDYKMALETLTRKQAYLKDKTIPDRPDDFAPAEPVVAADPTAELSFDQTEWEDRLRRLSLRFEDHPAIQDANVNLFAGAMNQWCINSEGTRVRSEGTGVMVNIYADLQAPDGMFLSDSISYLGLQPDELPTIEKMLADVDALCSRLGALAKAETLDHYGGPVLFDPVAAGKVFETLLANGLAARPVSLGQSWGDESMEKKIGRRILPRSFQVYDDPRPEWFEGKALAGAYDYDDEGMPARRVDLVEDGVLQTLLAGRAPTRKIKQTTGHGRSNGFSDARATIGCLYISDDDGVSADELKQALIEAAEEEGLAFGLRIKSMESWGAGFLGNPTYAYKVYVDDGREELIRGLEFEPVEPRALKRILAAGTKRKVHNISGGTGATIIAPAILFEELELNKPDTEHQKLPILQSPAQRKQTPED